MDGAATLWARPWPEGGCGGLLPRLRWDGGFADAAALKATTGGTGRLRSGAAVLGRARGPAAGVWLARPAANQPHASVLRRERAAHGGACLAWRQQHEPVSEPFFAQVGAPCMSSALVAGGCEGVSSLFNPQESTTWAVGLARPRGRGTTAQMSGGITEVSAFGWARAVWFGTAPPLGSVPGCMGAGPCWGVGGLDCGPDFVLRPSRRAAWQLHFVLCVCVHGSSMWPLVFDWLRRRAARWSGAQASEQRLFGSWKRGWGWQCCCPMTTMSDEQAIVYGLPLAVLAAACPRHSSAVPGCPAVWHRCCCVCDTAGLYVVYKPAGCTHVCIRSHAGGGQSRFRVCDKPLLQQLPPRCLRAGLPEGPPALAPSWGGFAIRYDCRPASCWPRCLRRTLLEHSTTHTCVCGVLATALVHTTVISVMQLDYSRQAA